MGDIESNSTIQINYLMTALLTILSLSFPEEQISARVRGRVNDRECCTLSCYQPSGKEKKKK